MTADHKYFDNLIDTVETIPTESIVSRTIFQNDQVKVIMFAFAPGQELSEHTASVAAMIQILQGTCSLILGENTYSAGPGSWAYLPPNTKHSLKAQTQIHMLLIMMQEK